MSLKKWVQLSESKGVHNKLLVSLVQELDLAIAPQTELSLLCNKSNRTEGVVLLFVLTG
jgi:hypothetical protein